MQTSFQNPIQASAGWTELLSDFSLEVPLTKVASFEPDPSIFHRGSKVYLPHLSNNDTAFLRSACQKLVELGYQPVPHVGARHFQTESQLRNHLECARSGGASRLLVLAGDHDDCAGPFPDALSVLKHPSINAECFEHISVAGHPEGHPRISSRSLEQALESKLELLDGLNIRASVTTQFGFDAQRYVSWIEMLRAKGIDAHISIGIAGITSIPSLIKYSVMCGIGPSLSTLRKRSGAMIGLLKGYEPTDVIDELSQATVQRELGQVGLHFFPFGGAGKTLDWLGAQLDTRRA